MIPTNSDQAPNGNEMFGQLLHLEIDQFDPSPGVEQLMPELSRTWEDLSTKRICEALHSDSFCFFLSTIFPSVRWSLTIQSSSTDQVQGPERFVQGNVLWSLRPSVSYCRLVSQFLRRMCRKSHLQVQLTCDHFVACFLKKKRRASDAIGIHWGCLHMCRSSWSSTIPSCLVWLIWWSRSATELDKGKIVH